MSKFGAIPTEVICRFHELTKTEIIVLSALFACRNHKSGRCHPSYSQLENMIGIAKPHIGRAVRSLVKAGWLTRSGDGQYDLLGGDEIGHGQGDGIGHSKGDQNGHGGGDQFDAQGVTNLVSEGDQNGHSYIKDLNNEGTKKEHRRENAAPATDIKTEYNAMDSEDLGYPYTSLFAAFPDLILTPAHLGLIEQDIKDTDVDREALRRTIAKYLGNRNGASYNPSRIGTFLGVFRDEKAKVTRNGSSQSNSNGHKPTPAEVIANRTYR